MFSKRDAVIFLAGAAALHTVSHAMLYHAGILPLKFYTVVLTEQLNLYAIVGGSLLTIALLWWASRLK